LAILGLGKPKTKGGPPDDAKEGKAYSKTPPPPDSSSGDLGDDEEEEMTNEGASFDAAAESLGQQLNVPQGKRAQFKVTLKEAIHACLRAGYKEE
jgi:hypothetical protein